MTNKEAIQILMLSPFYFKMDIQARKILISEFCSLHSQIATNIDVNANNAITAVFQEYVQISA